MKYNLEVEIRIDTEEEDVPQPLSSGASTRLNTLCNTKLDSLEEELANIFCGCIRGISRHIPGGIKLTDFIERLEENAGEGFK